VNLVVFLILLPVVLVGFVAARRQPGNPLEPAHVSVWMADRG
jgi:hypothetical protein